MQLFFPHNQESVTLNRNTSTAVPGRKDSIVGAVFSRCDFAKEPSFSSRADKLIVRPLEGKEVTMHSMTAPVLMLESENEDPSSCTDMNPAVCPSSKPRSTMRP